MVFIQTLFPEPVAPATSKWGISVRSATIGLPSIPIPRAKGILSLDLLNSLDAIISFKPTVIFF